MATITWPIKHTFRTEGLAIVMSTTIISDYISLALRFLVPFKCVTGAYWLFAGMVSALLADLFITPILFKYLHIFGKGQTGKGNR